ncbi:MAG: TIGR04282 family arsenosugar biosynthesis glycosyltransferase [Desulfuromonadaceae bacterium]
MVVQDKMEDKEHCAIIVMTRYPEAGKVKTRLIEELGEHGATHLHQKMAEYTISTLDPLCDIQTADLWIFFSGGSTGKMQTWLGEGPEYRPQEGDTLGHRMAHAFEQVFGSGYNRAVMLGTDCPDIEGASVVKALKYLRSADVVLGPAQDGGYYLIGLNELHPGLFRNIDWGSARVLNQTSASAKELNLTPAYLAPLRDIDTPEDLESIRGTFLLP